MKASKSVMRSVRESRNPQTSGRSPRVRQFSLTSFREAQRVVVRACGRLILGHGADQHLWAPHVDQATVANVALDLSCVNDVDARGLGLLADLVQRARRRGTIVSVTAASRVVQRLAEMTRLDRALPGAWLGARGASDGGSGGGTSGRGLCRTTQTPAVHSAMLDRWQTIPRIRTHPLRG